MSAAQPWAGPHAREGEPAAADAAPPDAGEPAPSAGTGSAPVDAAVAELDAVAGLPPQEQIPAYESAHRTLQDTLASIDES